MSSAGIIAASRLRGIANTFIDGVGTITNSKAALASTLGIPESQIYLFKIIGSNVEAGISGSFSIAANAFNSRTDITRFESTSNIIAVGSSSFFNATNLSSFIANSVTTLNSNCFRNTRIVSYNAPNLVSIIGGSIFNGCSFLQSFNAPIYQGNLLGSSFRDCTSLNSFSVNQIYQVGDVEFNNCTSLISFPFANLTRASSQSFRNTGLINVNAPLLTTIIGGSIFNSCVNLETFNAPILTQLGATTADDLVFFNIKTGCQITVPIALQTANGGSPDGDLVYASGTRAATITYI